MNVSDLPSRFEYRRLREIAVQAAPSAASRCFGRAAGASSRVRNMMVGGVATYSITSSADLMTNYVLSDVLEPSKAKDFKALQTQEGASLLFAVGTAGELNVIVQSPGAASEGWTVCNLSKNVVSHYFPDGGAQVSTFTVSQCPGNGQRAIHIAMAVVANGVSTLFLSFHNSDLDLSWALLGTIAWQRAPFNAVDGDGNPIPAPSKLDVVGLMLADARIGEQLVVDIARGGRTSLKSCEWAGVGGSLVSRYFISGAESNHPVWVEQRLPADLEVSTYNSCMGKCDRTGKQWQIEGVYSVGRVANVAQLVFVPLYNYFAPEMAAPVTRFKLPDGAIPDAIATTRIPVAGGKGDCTDLYVAAGGSLYLFPAAKQIDGAEGLNVITSPLLQGTIKLFAQEEANQVTVWGLNKSNQVFYFTCPKASVALTGAEAEWHVPPGCTLASCDAMSPYVNRRFQANTFFAHTSTGLRMYTQTPNISLWTSQAIHLEPTSVMQPPQTIKSFTTQIRIANLTTGDMAVGARVRLSATIITAVMIDHLYYTIGPDPTGGVTVLTDNTGTVTIMQVNDTLSAARFQVMVLEPTGERSSELHDISPMNKAMARNCKLDTVEKLKAARITMSDGTQVPFLPNDTPEKELATIAESNAQLAKVYTLTLSLGINNSLARRRGVGPKLGTVDKDGSVWSSIGDLFSWIASGVKALVKVIKDATARVWTFVAEIAGKVYKAILDTVEAIGEAVMWLYNQIKAFILKVIEFLEFLFNYQDILRTYRVTRHLLTLCVGNVADRLTIGLDSLKKEVRSTFHVAKKGIADLTGLPGYDELTPRDKDTASFEGADDDAAASSVPMYHLQGQGGKSETPAALVPLKDSLLDVIKALGDILKDEITTITNAYNKLKAEVIDKFNELSLTQIVARILGIIGIFIVETVENITIGVLNLLSTLFNLLASAITYEIEIPIVSWLFRLITGGDEISMVNIVAFVAAFPVTIVYKLAVGETPFPDDEWTHRLIAAPTLNEFVTIAYEPPEPVVAVGGSRFKGKTIDVTLGVVCSVGMLIRISLTAFAEFDEFSPFKFGMACFRWIGRLMTSISGLINAYSPDAGWAKDMNTTMTITKLCRDALGCYYTKVEKTWGKVATKPYKVAVGWWGTAENVVCLVGDIAMAVQEPKEKRKGSFALKWVCVISNHCGGTLGGPKSVTEGTPKYVLIGIECLLRLPYMISAAAVPLMDYSEEEKKAAVIRFIEK